MNFKSQFEKISGIYRIINIKNKLSYIGSSNNLSRRLKIHYCELRHNYHANIKLQNDFNKYGEESFEIEILALFPIIKISDLRNLEQKYIDKFDTFNNGYNLVPVDLFCFSHEELSLFAKKASEKKKKKVYAFNKLTGELVYKFNSVTEAAKTLKTSTTNISGVCKGRVRSIMGFTLIYEENYNKNKSYKFIPHKIEWTESRREKARQHCSKNKKVYKYDKNNNLVEIIRSRAELERKLNVYKGYLRNKMPYITENYIYSHEQIN